MSKIALAIICKDSENEAQMLYKCLENLRDKVDGVFVTITKKKDAEYTGAVHEMCRLFDAEISEFEWCNDFSAARNFNFSQVPKEFEYIIWCDADDIFRNVKTKLPVFDLHSLVEENPNVDVFLMNYLYAFDEEKQPVVVHMKSQIVRNDGSVTWVGKLHEDFKPSRELNNYLVADIERIHTSTEERFEEAKERNLEVALGQIESLPNDPRSYWNVGNSLKALGRNIESIDIFKKFQELSSSDEEKYIARLRMGEAYYGEGDIANAIEQFRYAIGLRPNYPDAYFRMGAIYKNQGNWLDAAKFFLDGMMKPKPKYTIMVYNPREYDYAPMHELAQCYFSMGRPDLAIVLIDGCLTIYPNNHRLQNLKKTLKKEMTKFKKVIDTLKKMESIEDKEELKRYIDHLPVDLRSHPSVCRMRNTYFTKTESSGKDLVYFCGFTEEEWTPETAKKKGIGGSEEAVIWLTTLLAKKGWNITVYNSCGHKTQVFDGVTYKPYWEWNQRDKQDVTIFWRSVRLLDYDINSENIYVDLHDVIPDGEFTEKRLKKIDGIFVKSNFHRSLFPNVPDDKFITIPNGIDAEKFKELDSERDSKLIINTSSPDRSVSAFIDIIEEVKKEVPDVKAVWAYGWGVFDIVHSGNVVKTAWKQKIEERMRELGIKNTGRLNHSEILELYKKANIFLYPSEFAEIDCISLSKAMAAGAIPVTTNFSAMGEKDGHGGFFFPSEKTKDTWCLPGQFDFAVEDEHTKKQMVERVVKLLKNPVSEDLRNSMRKWAIEKYSWELIAEEWDYELRLNQ